MIPRRRIRFFAAGILALAALFPQETDAGVGAVRVPTPRASRPLVRVPLATGVATMPYEVRGGLVFVGGDMVVGRADEMTAARARPGGAAEVHLAASEVRGWPGGIIPYELTAEYLALHSRKRFEEAVAKIHRKTALRLIPRAREATYLRVTTSEGNGGCFAGLGRRGEGPQTINLGRGCGSVMTHVHEIFHTLGMPHEHQRDDRDKYVEHLPQNVRAGKEDNFVKFEARAWLNPYPYDYGSLMHYATHAFSNGGGPTLRVRSPPAPAGQRIGQRARISPGDVRLVNYLVQVQGILDGTRDHVMNAVPVAASSDDVGAGGGGLFGLY